MKQSRQRASSGRTTTIGCSARTPLAWACACAAMLLPAAACRGQADERVNTAPPPDQWTLRIEPMLWYPALRGDLKMPGGSLFDLKTVDGDENEAAGAARITFRIDEWTVEARGFLFSMGASAAASDGFALGGGAVAAGDRVRTEIDLAGFDLTVGRRVLTPVDDPANEVRLSFDLYGGVRLHSIDTEVRVEGGGVSSRGDGFWAEPIGGGRMVLDLPHGFGLNLSLDIGGFSAGDDSSFSWDVTTAFFWMPGPNLGVQIGFRHLQMDLSKGSGGGAFEFDAALAGLFGAVVIRF